MDRRFIFFIYIVLFTSFFSCNEESSLFVCPAVSVSVSGRAEDDLYIRGSFNNWQLATPMLFKDGKWSVELNLKAGDYPYNFYSKRKGSGFNDPDNSLTMFDKGVRYSRLMVRDCKYPDIKLAAKPSVNIEKGEISFAMEYFPGIAGASPDLKKTKILHNYEKVEYRYDSTKKLFLINAKGLEKGKHTWSFKVFDSAGFSTETVTVPVWIEEQEFKWEDGFIYQIMTDRFKNGDETNDAPFEDIHFKANWQGGDFRGIIEKIDDNYFTDMGVNALWISSPVINTNHPGKGMGNDPRYYSAYHSYWPIGTGWTETNRIPGLDTPIEKRFGTVAELKELVKKAHAKGIRVLLDVVPNHVHTDSYLWETYRNMGWFHLAGDGLPANVNGGYTCGWERPVECWFTDYLADIDHTNIDAMNSVVDHIIWLVQEFDIDGLRIDAVRLMIIDFTTTLQNFIQRKVTTTGIPFYMIGETFTNDKGWDEIGMYVGEDKLEGQFDFPLYHHIVRTFLLQSENFETFTKFLKENDYRYQRDYFEFAVMGNFIGNHDVARALSLANRDFDGITSQGGAEAHAKVWENSPTVPEDEDPFKKMRNSLTFMFTHPGIPIIYQGDEFGMPGANDPDNRRMMVFGDDLTDNQKETIEHTKILGNFRRSHPSFRHGNRINIEIKDNFYAFAMVKDDDTVIAVFNNSDEEFEITLDISKLKNIPEKMSGLFSENVIDIAEEKMAITLEPFSSELFYKGD
jgi:neopullulanase